MDKNRNGRTKKRRLQTSFNITIWIVCHFISWNNNFKSLLLILIYLKFYKFLVILSPKLLNIFIKLLNIINY